MFLLFRSFCLTTSRYIQFILLGVIVITATVFLPILALKNVFAAVFLSVADEGVLLNVFGWWGANGIWNVSQYVSTFHAVAIALLMGHFFAIETLVLHHCDAFELIFEH